MLTEQAYMLHQAGMQLFEKVKECRDVRDIQQLLDMAQQCWRESREILSQINATSDLLFIEYVIRKGSLSLEMSIKELRVLYMEFCKRSGLPVVSDDQFKQSISTILGDTIKLLE